MRMFSQGSDRRGPSALQAGGDGQSAAGVLQGNPQRLGGQSRENTLTLITHTNPTPPPAVPDGRRDPQGAARPAGGQVQLRDDGQGVSEAGPGGEDRGGPEAVGGGGKSRRRAAPAVLRAASSRID